MLEYALMGAQAAGLVGDIWASSASGRVGKLGQQLEEQQLDLRLKQERIASQEQSLAGLEQLQEVLATQRAFAAVRGGLPGIGSNLAVEQKSITNFNRDEQARALNLEFGEQQRRAQMAAGRLSVLGKRAQSGAATFSKAFDILPLGQWGDSLGKDSGKIAPVEKAKPTTSKKPGIISGAK